MNKFTKFVKDFWQDEEGLTVVEYVIAAGLLAAALAVLFQGWGSILQAKLQAIFS
ncbi:Flp family type IVb pilin [Vibrio fluvialis]|nr:Flp family type IVb pilin [Vibrio fluvialis]MBY8189311.1 Flp family type IVb pilin [Vibrio fluvialis]